jgi:hypothetical protein
MGFTESVHILFVCQDSVDYVRITHEWKGIN